MLFQARGNVHLYTELEAYKREGARAVPALSCVFYTDFKTSKGIVLMRGQLNAAQLQPTDAAFLGNQTTIWYFDDVRLRCAPSPLRSLTVCGLTPGSLSYARVEV